MAEYPALMPAPFLLLISGPSGAGKSTLLRRFLERNQGFAMSISATTRAPRAGERDGIDYHFLDHHEFERRVAAGEFLEHARVFGRHWYGTPRAFVEDCFRQGLCVIKDIDVQGAAQLRGNMDRLVQVFVVPPDRAAIEERLRARNSENEDSVTRRLRACDAELSRWREYDYLVVNDDLDRACADVEAVVRAYRLSVKPAAHAERGAR